MSLAPWIKSASYDADKRELLIRMLGGAGFMYAGVPKATGEATAGLTGDALVYAFDTGIEGKFKSVRTG